jgi:hypothetical protein
MQAPATIGAVCAPCWIEIASDIFRLLDDVCDVLDAAGDGHAIMIGRVEDGGWRASLVAASIGSPPIADGNARGLPDAIKHLREAVIR